MLRGKAPPTSFWALPLQLSLLLTQYEPNGDIDSLRQLMAVPELEAGSVDQKESSEEKRAAPEDDEPRGPDGNQDELDR